MKKIYPIVFTSLFLIGLFFSTYKLTESPPFWYDEGWYFQTAANLATEGIDGVQLVPGGIHHVSTYVTVGYPLIYPLAAWFKIFGISVASGRSLMVIFICCLLIAAYFLSWRVHGKWFALAALALLVTFPPLYGNGKSILGEVPGLLYLTLFLICFNLFRTVPSRKLLWLILGGLFAGLCIATKPFFIILAPALLVGVCIEWKRGHITPREIGIGLVSMMIPILLWAFIQFRSTDSIFEILRYYVNPYDKASLTNTIIENIRKLFSDVGTLFTVFLVGVWTIAGILRLRKKESIVSVEIVAFIFSFLSVLAFLRTGGLYRYLFPGQAIDLLFFPYALSSILRLALPQKHSASRRNQILTSVAIACLSLLGLYQVMFNSWVADNYNLKETAFWEDYFSHIPATTSVFFYDTPEVTPFIQHRNYYQFILSPAGSSIGSEVLPVLNSALADKVFITTSKYEAASSSFPGYVEEEKIQKYSILRKK